MSLKKIESHQMKRNIRDFLHHCETMDFGRIIFSKTEGNFYRRFSNEIIALCRSLPESVRTDSILFLLKYFGVNLSEGVDFYAHFYAPTWSILYWLSHNNTLPTNRLKKGDINNAVTAQSMAMLLHTLDDHLTDEQLNVSPLTLLLRSQAWTIMNRALGNLAKGIPGGSRTSQGFLGQYYSNIQDSKEQNNLDSYCCHFRKQMAIGMVAPILLSMKMERIADFARDMEMAYGSFGIAWRLLDDIRDIDRDMERGAHSAIYLCLPNKMRNHWNNHNNRSRTAAKEAWNAVLDHLLEYRLIEKIKERICEELRAASAVVEIYGLKGLSREFKCLAYPLRKSNNT